MKFPLIIGLHNHQPVHNFKYVIDEAVEKSYLPFLKAAAKFPTFKFAVHYSGWLLEYIIRNHPDTFASLKKLCDNGQIEFFGGGYYEPILSAIPARDRIGQINKLTGLLNHYFGVKPKGLWLTERVWDPAIIPSIAECGIEDVIVDDYHFIAAGFNEASLTGYFRTEQDGYPVNIFPIDKGLRYKIPFHKVNEILEYIEESETTGKKFLTCFDDGEKFGLWPETFEHVYKNGWLEEFMEALTTSNKIATYRFDELKKILKPTGIAYLPITSYPEMGEWALFTDSQNRLKDMEEFVSTTKFENDAKYFLKGSIWKNFFVKYPESNQIHKRTLNLSAKNLTLKNSGINDTEFEEYLYMSQCNDCLWHGAFGGLYLPNLRDNAWEAIIKAEKRYETIKNINYPEWAVEDIDFDGYVDLYLRTKDFNAQFISRDGAQISSLELKSTAYNILNTLSRRAEGYHSLLTKKKEVKKIDDGKIETIHDKAPDAPEEFKKYLAYDWYNKNCFIDHFVDNYSAENMSSGKFNEIGDFVNQPFELQVQNNNYQFTRKGGIFTGGSKKDAVLIKEYSYKDSTISANYNFSGDACCTYVQEHNFHYADPSDILINGKKYSDCSKFSTNILTIFDNYSKSTVELKWNKNVDLYIYTVNTISLAVDRLELTTQGICIQASFDINQQFDLNVAMKIF